MSGNKPSNQFFNKNILVKLSKKFLDGRAQSDPEISRRFAPNLLNQQATFLEGVRIPTNKYNLIIQFSTGQTLAGLDIDDLEWLPE